MLTLKAVKAALASSVLKQTFINLGNQLLLLTSLQSGKMFMLLAVPQPVMANALEPLPLTLAVFTLLPALPLVRVPLSTAVQVGSLHGNHLDPRKKGMIDNGFTGEIPMTPEVEEIPIDCFINEINPITSGDGVSPPRISLASLEYMEEIGLTWISFDLARRESE